jgi:predicted ribonuclease YlaK
MKVFFDTMIFLHYRSLDQLDLTQILGPSPHTLMVPRITLRELDKHKNAHKLARIQARARKVLKKIEAWSGGEEVRPGISAEFLAAMPIVDYAKLGLNPDWSDDLLIATVLQYKTDHPEESVILVTQDSGPRMTASQLGITVLELPADWKLPVEPDPLEVENRELAKTIAALQNALPKLIVSFSGADEPEQHAIFALPPPPESM